MSAREEMLARISAAVGPGSTDSARPSRDPGQVSAGEPAADSAARYRTRGQLSGPELLDLLAGRLTDYRALVHRATPVTLADEISAALRRRQARRVVVPPALRLPLPEFVTATADTPPVLSAAELDAFDGVITRAAVAIAETGTIVLDGSPDQGRRAISLVPDYHLCVVEARQVVHLVPEAVERLSAGRPLTWISGPSATSDIELERVEGVHGPRTLEVVLVSA
ncbi:MAG TPA: LUD domain-containing protein [Streptosporangiaceae bacterium]|nr:LUD domain-containing protein [Streptosporangiaceae bacterium]